MQNTFDYVAESAKDDITDAGARIPEQGKKPRENTGNHPDPMEQSPAALAVIEIKKESALTVFTTEKGLDPYIEELERRARAAIAGYDITTIAGQDGIRSVAYSLAKSKKPLENLAADLKRDAYALVDKVNSERDRGIKAIDDLQKELRRPLTEYEEKEKARVSAHQERLSSLLAMTVFDGTPPSGAIQIRIDGLSDFDNIEWQEFTEPAKAAREKVTKELADLLIRTKKAEDEAAELARLRKAEEERAQKEREDRIAAEAAAKAKAEAEEKAAAEARAAAEKIEAERIAKEKAEQEAKDSAARAEKAEADRIAAEKKAIEDAEKAKAEADRRTKEAADQAAQAERDRHAEEQRKKKAEDDARAADLAHKTKIHNESLAVIQGIMDELFEQGKNTSDISKAIITWIAQGKVPNINIKY